MFFLFFLAAVTQAIAVRKYLHVFGPDPAVMLPLTSPWPLTPCLPAVARTWSSTNFGALAPSLPHPLLRRVLALVLRLQLREGGGTVEKKRPPLPKRRLA